jgi:uncharacterized protein YkwD
MRVANNVTINPQLRLAAQWHTDDVLNNAALASDIGTDGSTVQDRANAAGFKGSAAEAVAINPALAITSNCANTQLGVRSENSLARTVVVAVYGIP